LHWTPNGYLAALAGAVLAYGATLVFGYMISALKTKRPTTRLWALAAILAALVADPAKAEDVNTLSFGSGPASCATFLQGPYRASGEGWILGFWSGLNLAGPNHQVGQGTDGHAIVAEVERICDRNPSISLQSAVTQHYNAVVDRASRQ
jgi:hypothetical protein